MDLAQHELFRVKVGKGGINDKYINRGCFFLVSSKIFRQELVCGSGKTPSKSKSKDKFYSNILIKRDLFILVWQPSLSITDNKSYQN